MGPPTLFTIPVLRYMKTYGLTHEQLAMVSVVQREWAAKMRQTGFSREVAAPRARDLDHLPRSGQCAAPSVTRQHCSSGNG